MTWSLKKHVAKCIPGISLDCVVFGYHDQQLHVLLLEFEEAKACCLPGGFLPYDEEMDYVAQEVLHIRTGLNQIYLSQFHTFSSINRSWDGDKASRQVADVIRRTWPKDDVPDLEKWFNQRFVSTAYFALINSKQAWIQPDREQVNCKWVPVQNLPPLVIDHQDIIETALNHLRKQINYLPIGKELLDQKFTMIQLQTLYEAILGRKLDRGNFQRKMLKLDILVRHEKLMTGAQNKAPYLYSINEKVYEQLLEEGIGFN